MSKHRKTIQSGNPPAFASPKPGNFGVKFMVVAVIVVAALGVWWWKSGQPASQPPASPLVETQASNKPPPAAVAVAKPHFQKLKGKWLRPDGGYVIDIKSADDSGKLDAAYLNPRPIHVAKAEATLEGAAIKAFIELQDVNYPGSTYTLIYEPDSDQLRGIYYQAVQQQRFEVAFERMK